MPNFNQYDLAKLTVPWKKRFGESIVTPGKATVSARNRRNRFVFQVLIKDQQKLIQLLNDADTRAKLVDAGAEVDAMSVAQFRAFVDGESTKYQRIIKETGVTAE